LYPRARTREASAAAAPVIPFPFRTSTEVWARVSVARFGSGCDGARRVCADRFASAEPTLESIATAMISSKTSTKAATTLATSVAAGH
jgi:hypothetical protein